MVGYPLDALPGSRCPLVLPYTMQTTQASPVEPFLSVRLDLDPQRIAELILKVYPQGLPPVRQRNAGYVAGADLNIVNAVTRLLGSFRNPVDAKLLTPLVADEIWSTFYAAPSVLTLRKWISGIRAYSKLPRQLLGSSSTSPNQ